MEANQANQKPWLLVSRGCGCGCHSGTYTIPVAKLMIEEEHVPTRDVISRALDKMTKSGREGLSNIMRMDLPVVVEIRLGNACLRA